MGRKPTPDGRRVPVSFKLTEDEAKLVDSLRGDLERGPWMRQAALSAANRDTGIPARAPGTAKGNSGMPKRKRKPPEPLPDIGGIKVPVTADDRTARGKPAPGLNPCPSIRPGPPPADGEYRCELGKGHRGAHCFAGSRWSDEEAAPKTRNCKHPANRRIGDYCAACETMTAKGKP